MKENSDNIIIYLCIDIDTGILSVFSHDHINILLCNVLEFDFLNTNLVNNYSQSLNTNSKKICIRLTNCVYFSSNTIICHIFMPLFLAFLSKAACFLNSSVWITSPRNSLGEIRYVNTLLPWKKQWHFFFSFPLELFVVVVWTYWALLMGAVKMVNQSFF